MRRPRGTETVNHTPEVALLGLKGFVVLAAAELVGEVELLVETDRGGDRLPALRGAGGAARRAMLGFRCRTRARR